MKRIVILLVLCLYFFVVHSEDLITLGRYVPIESIKRSDPVYYIESSNSLAIGIDKEVLIVNDISSFRANITTILKNYLRIKETVIKNNFINVCREFNITEPSYLLIYDDDLQKRVRVKVNMRLIFLSTEENRDVLIIDFWGANKKSWAFDNEKGLMELLELISDENIARKLENNNVQ